MMERSAEDIIWWVKFGIVVLILFAIEGIIDRYIDSHISAGMFIVTSIAISAIIIIIIFFIYKNEISLKAFEPKVTYLKDSIVWNYYPNFMRIIGAAKTQLIIFFILLLLAPIILDLLFTPLIVYIINGGFRVNVVEVSSEGITINNNFKSWKNFLYYKSDKNLNVIKLYNNKYFLLRNIFPIIIFADKNFDDVERKISNYLRKAG